MKLFRSGLVIVLNRSKRRRRATRAKLTPRLTSPHTPPREGKKREGVERQERTRMAPGGKRSVRGRSSSMQAMGKVMQLDGTAFMLKPPAGIRGRDVAQPPGLPAARVRAGQATRRPRTPARARHAAPARAALLPGRA